MSKTNEEIIREVYYDPLTGFSGVNKTFQTLKKQGHKVSRKEIQKFIKKQQIAQINKKNIGKSGSFIPPHPLYEFQIDLIYLENKNLNKASYGLVCIDTFTKKGDVELIKRKSAPEVTNAMREILKRMGIPKYVYCDEGKEFDNELFLNLMKENKIEVIFSLTHAPMVERLNRTIKELLEKYLQATGTKTITNVLPKIIKNYNNSYHTTIKMAPNEVNENNQAEVYNNILQKATIKLREPINVGDRVRVQLKSKTFQKGYKPKFSKEIYTVDSKEGKYYIINSLNRKYLRAFLQKVSGDVEVGISPVDLEGTKEGFLKELAQRPIDPESLQIKTDLEEQRKLNPIASRTRNRESLENLKEVSLPAPSQPKKRKRKKTEVEKLLS